MANSGSTLSSGFGFMGFIVLAVFIGLFAAITWFVSGKVFISDIPSDSSGTKKVFDFILLIVAWGICVPLGLVALLFTIFWYTISKASGDFSKSTKHLI